MTDKTITYDLVVVGLKFRWNGDLRRELALLLNQAPMSVDLVREPDNEYDANAIRVEAPLGSFNVNDKKKGERTGGQLGYLRADSAEILAPKMDEGTIEVVSATLFELEAPEYSNGAATIVFKKLTR